jgi:integrase
MTAAGFRKQLARIGMAAEFPFPVHPHMLRHACGFNSALKKSGFRRAALAAR